MKSDVIKVGANAAPQRSLLNALGLTEEEMKKPLIGIVSSKNDIVPGHMNLDKIVDAVKQGVALAGGVSANSAVRGLLEKECKKNGMKLYMPPMSLCGDNAAMVGSQGYYEFISGNVAGTDLNAFATMSIE